jgi:hypothetical protein
MKVNINHPTFVAFLDNVTNSILTNVNVENYFTLPQEKKMGVLYMVFKMMKSSVKVRSVLSDNEMKSFISVLWKKNEELENYELVGILKDISNNYDAINEVTKTPSRRKTIKTDKNKNE